MAGTKKLIDLEEIQEIDFESVEAVETAPALEESVKEPVEAEPSLDELIKQDMIEQEVEEAEENLVNVRLNHGKQIGDRETYVDALLAAHNRVENSKTKLMNLEHTIETLKAELTAVSA
jgi:CRISPR/Cas system-associated protein Cas5 (RAMP superfamily)